MLSTGRCQLVDVEERAVIIRKEFIPAPDPRGNYRRDAPRGKRFDEPGVVGPDLVNPGIGDGPGGDVLEQFGVLREGAGTLVYVGKETDAFAVALGLLRDMPQDLHECLERVFAWDDTDLSQRPGLVEADVIPWAGEELRRLLDPVVQHLIHAWVAGIELPAVSRQPEIGVFLEAEQVVHVAVKFHAGNDINMALAGVFDDVPDLLARVAAIGIHDVVAFKLDAGLGIEVVLVDLKAGHQVYLTLGFRYPDQFSLAEVYHDPAVGQRRPVFDLRHRQGGLSSGALHHLQQCLHAIEDAG